MKLAKILKKFFLKDKISLVDIGALGFTYKPLEEFGQIIWYHGFDPAFNTRKKKPPIKLRKKWKLYSLYNSALDHKKGYRNFYIYNAKTNNSFLKSNDILINRYNMKKKWTIMGKKKIPTHNLDQVFKKNSNDKFFGDIIKIDTQGTELDILKGAKDTLRNTKFIISEVSFSELYHNQKLFSDLEIFLRKIGFKFYCFSEIFYRSKKILNKKKYLGRERMIQADAIFIKDPLDQKNSNLKIRDIFVILVGSYSFNLYDYCLELTQNFIQNRKLKEEIKSVILNISKKHRKNMSFTNIKNINMEKKIDNYRLFTNYNEYK